MNKSFLTLLVVTFVLSIAGLLVYVVLSRSGDRSLEQGSESKMDFISPIFGVSSDKNISLGARIRLQEQITNFGEGSLDSGLLTNYGIYFRELMGGPVIAIRQTEDFSPASLLKIPVALWFFKQAERNPELLSEAIQFLGPKGVSIEAFPPKHTIVEGGNYTIEELIYLMLVESDNDATSILVEYAKGRDAINSVYLDLGFEGVEDYNTYVIDVQTYIAFFRILFNAEYLSPSFSNRVLEILAQSSFVDGLRRDIPESIPIAHKFGERTIDPERGVVQLHDCGIVYFPHNPYLICIMTQGSDYKIQADFIADVSNLIYKTMQEQN